MVICVMGIYDSNGIIFTMWAPTEMIISDINVL